MFLILRFQMKRNLEQERRRADDAGDWNSKSIRRFYYPSSPSAIVISHLASLLTPLASIEHIRVVITRVIAFHPRFDCCSRWGVGGQHANMRTGWENGGKMNSGRFDLPHYVLGVGWIAVRDLRLALGRTRRARREEVGTGIFSHMEVGSEGYEIGVLVQWT